MEHKKNMESFAEGILPPLAPLANPYVPFQAENPPKYEARKGMIRGTLFPGLDLPFMGMVNQKEKRVTPETELQAMAFAIQELALYLDTHRGDKEALELFTKYRKMANDLIRNYEMRYGPLTVSGEVNLNTPFKWESEKWPWEV